MVIVLAPAPAGLVGVAKETILLGRSILVDVSDGHDRHVVLTDRNGMHRLTIIEPDHLGGHHVALVPDDSWLTRLAALELFARRDSAMTNARLHPTPAQRRRLTLMLQALDLLNAALRPKPTLRHIAETVLYPRHELGRAIEWKGSSQRRQTQRLVNSARHLMQDGYRELLKGRIAAPVGKSTAIAISRYPVRQTIERGNLP